MPFIHNLNPVLFNLGPLQIRYYGLLLALSLLIGYLILKKLAKRKQVEERLIESYIIWLVIGTVLGARIFHIISDFPFYINNPLQIIAIWKGGIASHGAILGGIIATYLFTKKHKLSFYRLADITAVPAALTGAFVRLGNFINGEIVGKITTLPWAVKFPSFEGFRHPSQLYEIIIHLFLFILLFKLIKKDHKPGFIFWLFITLYALLRFLVEFVKEYQIFPTTYIMDWGQLLSIPFLIIGIIMLIRVKRK